MTEPNKFNHTQAGDRSILNMIWQILRKSRDEYGKPVTLITIDEGDAHLLAKELKAGPMSGDLINRKEIENRIKEGRLELFSGVRVRVAPSARH